jgi:hypothetical protein
MEGKKWRKAISFATLAILWPVLSVQAGQKVQYGLKLAKGRSYDVRMVSDSNIVQESQGQEARSQVSLGFGYRFDVNAVEPNGTANVDCTVTWVKFRQKSPQAEMVYDSSDKEHPIPAEVQGFGPAGLLGERFSARITPQGQVQQIRGIAAMRRSMEKKLPEGPTRDQAMQGLSEEQLTASVKEYFLRPLAIYPDKPVGIGDSWSRSETSGIAPYDSQTKWTLKARKAGVLIIDADTTMKPKPPSEQRGAVMSGQSHGQIEIDDATGRIVSSRTTQAMSGQMTVGSSALGVKTDSTTTFQMTDRKPGTP